MIKLAIVHGPLVIGGAEKSLINLLNNIDYTRFDVSLWLKDNTGSMEAQIDSRVTIRYWGIKLEQDYSVFLKELIRKGKCFRIIHSVLCRILSRVFVRNWHKNYKYCIKSLSELFPEKYDIGISYHSLVKEDLMILDYAVKARKKIGWIHGACRHDFDNPYFEPFPIEYKKLDHIFCVSFGTRDTFLEKYPSLYRKTSVMYNLQNFDQIRKFAEESIPESFDGLTLVTVGRLSPEKGQVMIPEIAAKLFDKGYEFQWYIIGDGQDKTLIQQEIIRHNVAKIVHMLGNKTNPYPYIYRASIYVQPSYSEGFCVTTFEAKILNTPVVVTDVTGMREQFTEDEAIFCNATSESLCEGILKAISWIRAGKRPNYSINESFNEDEIKKLYSVVEI